MQKAILDIVAFYKVNTKKPAKTLGLRQRQQEGKADWYFCTFCGEGFDNEFAWSQHEQDYHLHLSSWTCMLTGPFAITPDGPRCAFCGECAPTSQHLTEQHNYLACCGHSEEERKFYVKDRFIRHVTEIHACEQPYLQGLDQWERQGHSMPGLWRCGICLHAGFFQSARHSHIPNH
jgi:hypothetical protein